MRADRLIAGATRWALPSIVGIWVIWAAAGNAQTPSADGSSVPAAVLPSITRILIDTHRVSFEGLGAPNAFVDINMGQRLLGIATVGDVGQWSLVIEQPPPVGEHRITVSSRAAAGAPVAIGQDVLVSIPEGFTGLADLSRRGPLGSDGMTLTAIEAELQRRHIEELAAAASEHFSEVLARTPWQRTADKADEARSAPPVTEAPAASFAPVAAMTGWVQGATREYHEQVVRRLAEPRAPAASTETNWLGGVQDWVSHRRREYHVGIVQKLSVPAQALPGDGAGQPAPATVVAPVAVRAPDKDAAAVLRKALEERQAELARAEAQRQAAATKQAEEEQRATEAAKAMQARADEARRAREAAAREAERQARAEAQRLASLNLNSAQEAERVTQASQSRAASEASKDPSAITGAHGPAGFKSDADYRRALAEAAHAPKERPRAGRVKAQRLAGLAPDQAPDLRVPGPADDVQALGFRSREAYRKALLRASRAPKALPERGPARGGKDRVAALAVEGYRKIAERGPVEDCPAAGRSVALPGTYTVQSGDTLWHIAERHYGEGAAYQRIVLANRARVPDPDLIEPCQRLVLPRR